MALARRPELALAVGVDSGRRSRAARYRPDAPRAVLNSFSTISSACAKPASRSPILNSSRFEMLDGLVGGGSTPRVIMSSNNSGASRLHRLVDVDDVRQHLVIDRDQRQRLVGDRLAGRGDGGDRMALIEHLLARHDVARHVPEILTATRSGPTYSNFCSGKSADGHHRLDAGQRRRLRGVDRADARMRVRRAQDAADQHARHRVVGAVHAPCRSPSARRPDGSAGFLPI